MPEQNCEVADKIFLARANSKQRNSPEQTKWHLSEQPAPGIDYWHIDTQIALIIAYFQKRRIIDSFKIS
jgi:hypothetical protein